MSKAIEKVTELLDEGYDFVQCLNFLNDGEALSDLGITDEDDVEMAVDFIRSLIDSAVYELATTIANLRPL